MNKSALRKNLLAVRAAIVNRDEKDEAIARAALNIATRYESVFIYVSIGSEVSTVDLAKLLLKNNKVYVPYTQPSGEMHAVPLGCADDIRSADKLGNTVSYSGETGDGKCELIFVPLLGFDCGNYRIGYGAGCYDRYFAEYPGGLKVGLAYDEQQCSFDREPTDVPLDIIITPTKTIRRSI